MQRNSIKRNSNRIDSRKNQKKNTETLGIIKRFKQKIAVIKMLSRAQKFNLILIVAFIDVCLTTEVRTVNDGGELKAATAPATDPKFVVIKEDVIPDVAENTTQKVIRVNPLDLPPIREDPSHSNMDSDLYKIQSILSPNRNYVNSQHMRARRPRPPTSEGRAAIEAQPKQGDAPIIRHLPKHSKVDKPKHQRPDKKKHLHFLYNQEAKDGRVVGKAMRVHTAPGAYPVYYAVSKTNGRFGKFPIKGFRNEDDFVKYLVKSKLEPIALSERFES